MTEITIGGRTIPLLYTTMEMVCIQEAVGCTAFQLKDDVFGVRENDDDDPDVIQGKKPKIEMDLIEHPDKIRKMCSLIRVLGNAGLEESGGKADLTDKWIMRNIKPSAIMSYAAQVIAEIVKGNTMETPALEPQTGSVDETLEEIQGKKQPGS